MHLSISLVKCGSYRTRTFRCCSHVLHSISNFLLFHQDRRLQFMFSPEPPMKRVSDQNRNPA